MAAILIISLSPYTLYKEGSVRSSLLSKTDMAYQVSKEEESLRKGPWLEEEDEMLTNAVALLGERRWDALAKESGLRRSGKSCRLRWLNYLRPNLKHGEITEEEELVINQLHQQWGNKWAKIARRLPGRTDNEIKNYWRTHLRKKIIQAQEQEDFDSAIQDAKVDPSVPFYGEFMYGKDCISRASDDSSCALSELSNVPFGSLTCADDRVSDWASSCWSYDHQSEAKQYQSQSKDQSLDSNNSCFCNPSWSFEEESDSSIWDCSSSFWS